MSHRPSRRPPNIGDVAQAAGVSRQTVSNALNAPERLRQDTLCRVLGAVQRLGYRPNRVARSLRRQESRLIGLSLRPALPDRAGSLLDRFLHALVEHSAGAGYHVLLFTPPDPDDEVSGFDELLNTTTVDAFVLTDTYRGDRRVSSLLHRAAPFVAFGRPWGDAAQHPWVDVDGAAGTASAVDHLVERGHRRIGFIGWSADSDLGNDRKSGWSQASRRHGVGRHDLVARCPDTNHDGAAATAALLDRPEPPTALVCASDTLAMGALATLGARGLQPARDVAVTGFDDTATAAVVPGGLTTVRQPLEDVAEAIVRRLDARLTGSPLPDLGELLTPALVVRGTT